MIPGTILLCHENAHQYYFSNRPKLLSVVLYVKQSLKKLFSICLPQTQEPEPNLHEPVTIDDMALESNLRAMARQAAARLTLAQQALDLQKQAVHAQYSKANEKNPMVQKPKAKLLVQDQHSQMSEVSI